MSTEVETSVAAPATPLERQNALAAWLPERLAEAAVPVTVVGDVILDGWWSGTSERLCREAPAPVVDLKQRVYAPGGAANTAMNLAALGAQVCMVGLVGADFAGRELRRLLREAGVDVSGLVEHPAGVTTTKYRVISGDQVVLRLDDAAASWPEEAEAQLASAVQRALDDASAVVVCDYGSGLLTGAARSALRDRPRGILTVVDAHDPRPWAVLDPDLVTPNAAEVARLLDFSFEPGCDRAAVIQERAAEVLRVTAASSVVVTLDRDGTILLGRDTTHRTWAQPQTEKQASGAGDTFVAALTLGRAAGLPLTTSADLGQAAADVVVRRAGTSVCARTDLSAHLGSFADTALTQEELIARIDAERAAGRRIVLTNGCFDTLLRGHTRYLNQAKQLGDVLVVAVNSDASARRLKGPGHPRNQIMDRAAVLAALSCVDYVTTFDSDTVVPLIEALRPDVYAKGGDYTPQMLAETPAVLAHGGQVRILDYVPEPL